MAACADGPTALDPGRPDAARQPTAALTVMSPTANQTLSGSVLFTAQVNWTINSYDVYWQDGSAGVQTKMVTDPTGTFKQSAADVSQWVSGSHTLIFTAKSHNKTLDTQSVTVTVNGLAAPPPTPVSGNPLAGATFWVDPNSNAAKQIKLWTAYPDSVAQMHKIADHSQADWFGGWNTDIQAAVDARTATIVGAGGLPVFVAYNIPNRDCGGYSAGGAQTADAYKAWIDGFAAGLNGRRAVVIVEPDGTAATTCLKTATELQTRYDLLTYAVQHLKAANAIVYLDAGNSAWIAASDMAGRLQKAGIAYADGFSLNVSNYQYTADTESYGSTISGLVGGKHFIVDTSRNGLGPISGEWCNVLGRGLGSFATTTTDNALVDAYLWIKRPGESDGTCNGGPAAGQWWADYALGLAQNMPALLASQ